MVKRRKIEKTDIGDELKVGKKERELMVRV